ncbi:unnamed protein product [Symbiodinium sp. CCMP2592]|nr:unnamed protein product [Symbiodinium sp. CCMP2592]
MGQHVFTGGDSKFFGIKWMSRALVSSSAGLSLTSLLLHLGRLFEHSPEPTFLNCPVCPVPALDFLDSASWQLHGPSVLLGLALGLCLFPALELILPYVDCLERASFSYVAGQHRGSSGRDRLPLQSRLWLDIIAVCAAANLALPDEAGAEVKVHCAVVGDIKGKLLICLPGAAWHRVVAKRTVPKGFLTRVFGAEVAVVAITDRAVEIAGQSVRVWLGYCEPEAEGSIEGSDATPTVPFGALPTGELLVPSVDVLAELWQAQQTGGLSTPMQSASEGQAGGDGVADRLAAIEKAVATLTASMAAGAVLGSTPKAAPAKPTAGRAGRSSHLRPPPGVDEQALGPAGAYPGLDRGVVAAALAAGVQSDALAQMSRLVSSSGFSRLKAEPKISAATNRGDKASPLEESGDEDADPAGLGAVPEAPELPEAADPAEAFAKAVAKCFDSLRGKSSSAKASALDKALDSGAGGSLDGSLSSGRRNAAARRALRESLITAPQELSALIEGLMAEDLCASTPGAGTPVLTSTRGWLEHRSRIQAYPTMVHLVWAIGGALDCLRSGQIEQARARLNLAILQADQASIDRGSWLLSQELSLEVGPPMSSFKKHEIASSSADPVYSRLLAFGEHSEGLWKKRNLEHLVFGSFFPLTFQPEDYGRIGHKVEGQAKTLEALSRAAASVCRSFAGYLPRSTTVAGVTAPGPSPALKVGTLAGKPDIAAMPIVADRVKLPACPAFAPAPFMDRTTAEFFNRPLDFARVPDPLAEKPPFVKILADPQQKLLLLRALARSGRLEPLSCVPQERAAWGAGLFAVAKDGERDRLVLDARPANELENFPGRWVHSLASAACLSGIVLRQDEVLLMSGTDLQDCFYQFAVTEQRVTRNHLACELSPSDAAFVFERSPDAFRDFGNPVLCGLSSLAMGDSSACEFAQCSHLGFAASSRLAVSVGLVIDDLIILQKCLEAELQAARASPGSSAGAVRLHSALRSYDGAKLRYSEKKTFEDSLHASFWGISCCGRSGLIRANPARYWPLVLITLRVLQLGLATRGLLESLLGSWVSVFMLRRRMLSLVELCFKAVQGGSAQTILRLSPELKSELASFVCLGHLAVVDLRAQPSGTIIATDASSSWQAAVSAEISPAVVAEFQRHSLQKGAWTKLLTPPSAWLKEHNLLEPESELPGDFEFSAHPVAEAFARVCLGCLVKGRSASPILNRKLRASLGPLLGSRLFPCHLFLPSALNPGDDPTRNTQVRLPSLAKPDWWRALEVGDTGPFDDFLAAAGADSDASARFVQDDLCLLGASRPAVLKSNRERGLSARMPRPLRRSPEAVVPSAWVDLSEGSAVTSATVRSVMALQAFPVDLFRCSPGQALDLTQLGVLVLYTSQVSVVNAFLRAGAPWVLAFDAQRGADQDLSCPELRSKLEALISAGAFRIVGARLLCSCKTRHLRLVGHSPAERLPWTSVASRVPAGFADAIAVGLCSAAQWNARRALDAAACAKLGNCCRVGEAKNPGPRRRSVRPPGDLESQPLQSQTSLFLGDSAWRSFLSWVSCHLSVDPVSLFVCCPILAAMALRAYGNHLYCSGGSKHSFRYTLVGAQRAILTLRGCLAPAWEILTRWEAAEPTIHRTPIPEPLLRAMVCIAWLGGFRRWCGCALLAFYGMARIGEVLSCERRHLVLPEDLFDFTPSAFLRLDSSKTSLRGRPRVQHIRVDDSEARLLIKHAFGSLAPGDKLFPFSHAAFRTRWDKCLASLGLRGLVSVTPGGLRGGGAVALYHRGLPVADIQWHLRLKHMATLEHYLQEVAALTALNEATEDAKSYIRTALQIFPFLVATATAR